MDLEDQQRFTLGVLDDAETITLACGRCQWVAFLDTDADQLTLAELNQRADEHTEVCT